MPETELLDLVDTDRRRELLTVLTAEHSNLQAARSTGVAEASGRTTSFFAALSGALVALALVAPVEALRPMLPPVAFVFAMTLTYIGLITFLRLVQLARMDSLLVVGINRIRHRYIELVPGLADVEVLSAHDDLAGIIGDASLTGRTSSRLDTLASAPALVAVIDGILAAVLFGLAATMLGTSISASLAIGVVVGLATDAALLVYGLRTGVRFWRAHPPRHPTPPA